MPQTHAERFMIAVYRIPARHVAAALNTFTSGIIRWDGCSKAAMAQAWDKAQTAPAASGNGSLDGARDAALGAVHLLALAHRARARMAGRDGWAQLDENGEAPEPAPARGLPPLDPALPPFAINLHNLGFEDYGTSTGGGPLSYLKGSLRVGNVTLHAEAYEVTRDGEGEPWFATNDLFQRNVDAAYDLSGDSLTALDYLGRQYVLVMYPYAA